MKSEKVVLVSGFPWSTLITATAPVVAAFGVVWLTERSSSKRAAAKALRTAEANEKRQVRDAYADVIKNGRMLAAARRDRDYRGTSDMDVDRQTREDVVARRRELNAAVAIVDLTGSTNAQAAARNMLKVSKPGLGQELKAEPLENAIDEFIQAVRVKESGTGGQRNGRGSAD